MFRDEDLIGRTVGGCHVVASLGQSGGQGRLFRAKDLEQESITVALKVIVASATESVVALQRFHREATIARLVEGHENVIRIYRAGRDVSTGLPYIVMELLEGSDLRSWLAGFQASGGLPPADAARDVLVQAARGVAVLHRSRAGIVHRDLKPGNLFLHRIPGRMQRVKVLDFGAARVLHPSSGLAELTEYEGAAPMTPAYASPEQKARGGDVGPEADVFSLGAVGYELFTGRRPYSPMQEQALQRGSTARFEPLGENVPAPVRKAISRALSPRPEQRFRDATAFVEALEARELPPGTRRRAAWLAGVVLLAALGMGIWAMDGIDNEDSPPNAKPPADSAPPPPPAQAAPRSYASVSAAGANHVCAVDNEGVAYCWGGNEHGELGTGSRQSAAEPVRVAGNLRFIEVEAGSHFSCGLSVDNKVYCWGDNQHGQLGPGAHGSSPMPLLVSFPRPAMARLSVGADHACARTEIAAYCWGNSEWGQLGADPPEGDAVVVPVIGRYMSIAAGSGFTCALDGEQKAFCWGRNDRGQLGDGGAHFGTAAWPVAGDHRFGKLELGPEGACGRATDGMWHCWGDNEDGVLLVGPTVGHQTRPAVMMGHSRWEEVALGGSHGCARMKTGETSCWGSNGSGQLGSPGGSTQEPRPVSGNLRFAKLSAGNARTCGITDDGMLYCWGALPESGAQPQPLRIR
jgi:hypothetical protein